MSSHVPLTTIRELARLRGITAEQESQIRTLRSEVTRAQAEVRMLKLKARKRAKT